MKSKTKCYWQKTKHQQIISLQTITIIHPFIDFFVVKYVQYISRSVFNINQSRQSLQRHTICITDFDNDYILDEICVHTKLIMRLMSSVCVYILKLLLPRSAFSLKCIVYCNNITLYYQCYSLYIFQLSLSINSHIYAYVINSHIRINTPVPIIHNLFKQLHFGSSIYIHE